MKIAFVITEFWPLIGGLQKLPLRLGLELIRNGHEVCVITRFTQARHPLEEYFRVMEKTRSSEVDGIAITVLTLRGIRRLLLIPVFKCIWRAKTFPIARFLYEAAFRKVMLTSIRDCDCVHYFGVGVEMLGFSALDAARRAKIPFLVEPAIHAGHWGEAPQDQILYQEADRLIAHTEFEAGRLLGLGVPQERIKVIHHGVDSAGRGQGKRFRGKYNIHGPVILFLARKTKAKGLELLKEAFSLVRHTFPSLHLVLAGPADELMKSLPDGVMDVGILVESEKADALDACDLLCVPSEGESFGMVYFEAWSYRKPVVALNLPTLAESIGRCGGGILAEPNALAVAEAICRLLGNPALAAKMGEAGFEFATRHSWEASAKNCLDVYEGCSI